MPMIVENEVDLKLRAIAAYCKTAVKSEGIPAHPCWDLSGAEACNGLDYVILRNVRGLLAAYRVTNSGQHPDNTRPAIFGVSQIN
jgi:hypothetical protein